MKAWRVDGRFDILIEQEIQHGYLRDACGDSRSTAGTEHLFNSLVPAVDDHQRCHRRDRPFAWCNVIRRTRRYAERIGGIRRGEVIHDIIVDDVGFRTQYFRAVAR